MDVSSQDDKEDDVRIYVKRFFDIVEIISKLQSFLKYESFKLHLSFFLQKLIPLAKNY